MIVIKRTLAWTIRIFQVISALAYKFPMRPMFDQSRKRHDGGEIGLRFSCFNGTCLARVVKILDYGWLGFESYHFLKGTRHFGGNNCCKTTICSFFYPYFRSWQKSELRLIFVKLSNFETSCFSKNGYSELYHRHF